MIRTWRLSIEAKGHSGRAPGGFRYRISHAPVLVSRFRSLARGIALHGHRAMTQNSGTIGSRNRGSSLGSESRNIAAAGNTRKLAAGKPMRPSSTPAELSRRSPRPARRSPIRSPRQRRATGPTRRRASKTAPLRPAADITSPSGNVSIERPCTAKHLAVACLSSRNVRTAMSFRIDETSKPSIPRSCP